MLRRLGRDERGNVLVIFATALPVMILIAALVLDVGNWYAHKRKLQSRVDDAVFAAALEYGYRFPECTSDPAGAGAQAIVASARRFAGDESVADPVNTGVNQPAPATTFDVNDPCVLNTTGDTVSPDGGYWLQMDGAETNVVSLFGGFGVPVPRIAAQARVALMRPETLTGVQPFAVADAALTECAWVRFRNNGGLQDSIQLTRQPGTNTWTGTDAVNEDGTFLAADVELGSCDNSARRVTYENVGYVDNYPTEVENTTVFQVVLSGSPCNGSYLYREGGNCTIGISANVVFPCAPPPGGGDPVRLVYASLGEPGDREILLTPDGDPDGTQPDWWTGQWANVAPGSGALDVTLRRACNGSFLPLGKQQAVMAGDDGQEGPIADFTLSTTTFTGSTAGTFSETATLVLDPLTSDEPDSLRVPIRGAIPTPGSFLSGAVACGPAGPSSVADAGRHADRDVGGGLGNGGARERVPVGVVREPEQLERLPGHPARRPEADHGRRHGAWSAVQPGGGRRQHTDDHPLRSLLRHGVGRTERLLRERSGAARDRRRRRRDLGPLRQVRAAAQRRHALERAVHLDRREQPGTARRRRGVRRGARALELDKPGPMGNNETCSIHREGEGKGRR
jgi:hypothetical protein